MPESLKRLIHSISLLPWIWEKSATKLAFFLLNTNSNYIEELRNNLKEIKENVWKCAICWSLTDKHNELCSICSKNTREKNIICVVEEYLDLQTIEQTWWYNWVYHVLGWAISPINWVFVSDLNFTTLFNRIEKSDNKIELIIATNPNIEWEATTAYLKEEIVKRGFKPFVTISRLSRWLSSGYIEYADNITLLNAIKERKEI